MYDPSMKSRFLKRDRDLCAQRRVFHQPECVPILSVASASDIGLGYMPPPGRLPVEGRREVLGAGRRD